MKRRSDQSDQFEFGSEVRDFDSEVEMRRVGCWRRGGLGRLADGRELAWFEDTQGGTLCTGRGGDFGLNEGEIGKAGWSWRRGVGKRRADLGA